MFQNLPDSTPAQNCQSAAVMVPRNDPSWVSRNGCAHSSKDGGWLVCTVAEEGAVTAVKRRKGLLQPSSEGG
ncbi:hypothetical protein AAC387_Pa05g3090 [Persea americana]